jgi:hypothetical protein
MDYVMADAIKLHAALEAANVSTYICRTPFGADIADEVSRAITSCELFVVIGTLSYGTKTNVPFATFEELGYATQLMKRIVVIRRCDQQFTDPRTQFLLQNAAAYMLWEPWVEMPENLVQNIIDTLNNQ